MGSRILLILTAGKVDPSMMGEFGDISHARIPYQSKPVFFEAIKKFQDFEDIFVAIDSTDETAIQLASLSGSSIINVDGQDELSDTIRTALSEITKKRISDYSIQILFGDTLVTPITKDDFIGVAAPRLDFQDWATIDTNGDLLKINEPGNADEKIIAGYFGFSSAFELQKHMDRDKFYLAITNYFNARNSSNEFVVDLAVWRDFGRADTYYGNRIRKQVSRNFNHVEIEASRRTVLKTSKDANKIAGEINWYLEIKNRGIAHIAPNFISHNKDLTEYRLEYLAIPPVSDVFIFGEKSLGYWQRLFNSLSRLLLTLRETVPEDKEDFWEVKLREDYLQRLEHRLSLLLNQKPNLPKVKIQTENRLVEVGDLIQSMKMWLNKYHPVPNRFGHGDLFFGNLFYQDKTDQLMCIDPRGIKFESEVFDLEYEYAKLFHSIIGSYDFLSADLFAVDFTNDVYKLFIPLTESHRRIQNLGKEIILESRSSQGLKPDLDFNLISYLFLTLAPLHSENHLRQIAALCTAAEFFDWS